MSAGSDVARDPGESDERRGPRPAGRPSVGARRRTLVVACLVGLALLLLLVTDLLRPLAIRVPFDPPPASVFIRTDVGTAGPDTAVYDGPDGVPIEGLEISNASDLGGRFGSVRISQSWFEVRESTWNRLRRSLGIAGQWSCASVESKTWHYGVDPVQTTDASAWNCWRPSSRWIELRRR